MTSITQLSLCTDHRTLHSELTTCRMNYSRAVGVQMTR